MNRQGRRNKSHYQQSGTPQSSYYQQRPPRSAPKSSYPPSSGNSNSYQVPGPGAQQSRFQHMNNGKTSAAAYTTNGARDTREAPHQHVQHPQRQSYQQPSSSASVGNNNSRSNAPSSSTTYPRTSSTAAFSQPNRRTPPRHTPSPHTQHTQNQGASVAVPAPTSTIYPSSSTTAPSSVGQRSSSNYPPYAAPKSNGKAPTPSNRSLHPQSKTAPAATSSYTSNGATSTPANQYPPPQPQPSASHHQAPPATHPSAVPPSYPPQQKAGSYSYPPPSHGQPGPPPAQRPPPNSSSGYQYPPPSQPPRGHPPTAAPPAHSYPPPPGYGAPQPHAPGTYPPQYRPPTSHAPPPPQHAAPYGQPPAGGYPPHSNPAGYPHQPPPYPGYPHPPPPTSGVYPHPHQHHPPPGSTMRLSPPRQNPAGLGRPSKTTDDRYREWQQSRGERDRDRRDRPRIRVPNLLRDQHRRRDRGRPGRDRRDIDRRDRDHRRPRDTDRRRDRRRSRSRSRGRRRSRSKSRSRRHSKDRDHRRRRSKSRDRGRSKRHDRSKDRDRSKRSRSRHRHRSRSHRRSRDRKSKERGSESKRRSRSPRDSTNDKSKSEQSKRDDSNNNHASTTSGVASQSAPNGSNSDAQSAVPVTQSQTLPVMQPSALPPPSAATEVPQSTNFETVAAFEADATKLLNPTSTDVDSDAIQNLDDTDSNKPELTAPPPCTAATGSSDQSEMKSNATTAEEEDSHSIHAQLLQSRDGPSASNGANRNAVQSDNDSEDDIDRRNIERRRNVDYEQFANHQVTVKGDNVPPAIEQFSECLSSSEANKPLLDNLEREQFSKPTPIQKHCLPLLLSNRDVMAIAQTGSGKTLAFLLPIVAQLLMNGEMTRGSWIRSFAVFGGANFEDQAREIEKFQVDILCATPGRLMDMVDRCKVSLEFIRHLAIDEADNMLSLGFTAQIRNIEQRMPNKDNRQTVLFSATMPKQIQNLAADFMKESVFIKMGSPDSEPAPITQIVKWVEEPRKRETLMQDIAGVTGKIIVFCGQRQRAESIRVHLTETGYNAGCLHGHMNQDKREEALLKFKDNQYRILAATSVAARGIDIPAIERVINYDMPPTVQDYTHRIGRTGRIGSSGVAISYFNHSSRSMAGALTDFLKANNQKVPQWLAEMPDYRK